MAVPDEASVGRPAMKKAPWTKEEDVVLRAQVRLHGARDWEAISAALPRRDAKSCRLRWCQHLSPDVDDIGPFTPEEDAAVVALQQKYPNMWSTVASHIPGRTDNAIKNRWNSFLRKQQPTTPPLPPPQNRALTLFPLVPGGIWNARRVAVPVIDYAPTVEGDDAGGGDEGGSCLNLFPLPPGDIARGDPALMDVDSGADDPLTQLRLFPLAPKEMYMPMDVDSGADSQLIELRLFPLSPKETYVPARKEVYSATAAATDFSFRVQAVMAP